MGANKPFISKSKYVDGLNCRKFLWYSYNKKNQIPEPDIEAKERMKQGIITGELAQQLFPEGIIIERSRDPLETTRRSLAALSEKKPLFEAGFTYNNGYALADILLPVSVDKWELIEVKSTTSVKDEHLEDAAFQRYVYEGNGLIINKCYLLHLNNDYMRRGELDLKQLFVQEDITGECDQLLPGIEGNIQSMLTTIAGEEPEIEIGSQCSDCLLKGHCWSFLPQDNVFKLSRGGKVSIALMRQGIFDIKDVPVSPELSDKHLIQIEAHRTGRPYVNAPAIRDFLAELRYPLYFLDFETIAPAIPIYDLTRPYEDVPFQFSLHVIEKEGKKPVHYSYLALGKVDPRLELLKRLQDLLGQKGTIVAYNATYELKCLRYAVRAYPKFAKWYKEIEARFVDLLIPFSNFFYYHPAQLGSASMKEVLPALTKISYKDLKISGGGMARLEYMRATYEPNIEPADHAAVFAALEQYCELDTKGMIDILDALRKYV